MAVTPEEERYVPEGIKKVLNIGHRSCTSGMMIEIAWRIRTGRVARDEKIPGNYFNEMATNNFRQL